MRKLFVLLILLLGLTKIGTVRAHDPSDAFLNKGNTCAEVDCLKAAEQGDAEAQFVLGLKYKDGLGAPQDYAEAVKWLRRAAEQGLPKAQSNLGTLYRRGQGVPQDYIQAVKWYREAAEQGLPEAQFKLGMMYAQNMAKPQDHGEAVKWFRKSAEQGNVMAQHYLGVMYYKGEGVPKDFVKAHMLFDLAEAQGSEHAGWPRRLAAENMTPAEISKAQLLARQCIDNKYKGCF